MIPNENKGSHVGGGAGVRVSARVCETVGDGDHGDLGIRSSDPVGIVQQSSQTAVPQAAIGLGIERGSGGDRLQGIGQRTPAADVLDVDVDHLGQLPIPTTLQCRLFEVDGPGGALWISCDRAAVAALVADGKLVLSPLEYRLLARLMASGRLGRITVRRALDEKAKWPARRIQPRRFGCGRELPQAPAWNLGELLEAIGADLERVCMGDEWRGVLRTEREAA